jgi:hypothetical protein
MRENFILKVVGNAKIGNREIVRTAVAAEDKMQAFLWRQLVPAKAFVAIVFDPNFTLPPERPVPVLPPKPQLTSGTAAALAIPISAATVATDSTSMSRAAPDAREANMMMADTTMAQGLSSQTNAAPSPSATHIASVPTLAASPTNTATPVTIIAPEPSPSVAPAASATPQPPLTSVNAQAPTPASPSAAVPAAPKFTKQQVAGRLKQLKILYEAGLLTDSFYLKKIKECEALQ